MSICPSYQQIKNMVCSLGDNAASATKFTAVQATWALGESCEKISHFASIATVSGGVICGGLEVAKAYRLCSGTGDNKICFQIEQNFQIKKGMSGSTYEHMLNPEEFLVSATAATIAFSVAGSALKAISKKIEGSVPLNIGNVKIVKAV